MSLSHFRTKRCSPSCSRIAWRRSLMLKGPGKKSESSHLLLSPLHPFYAVFSSRLPVLRACTSPHLALWREEEKECVSLDDNSSPHQNTPAVPWWLMRRSLGQALTLCCFFQTHLSVATVADTLRRRQHFFGIKIQKLLRCQRIEDTVPQWSAGKLPIRVDSS